MLDRGRYYVNMRRITILCSRDEEIELLTLLFEKDFKRILPRAGEMAQQVIGHEDLSSNPQNLCKSWM